MGKLMRVVSALILGALLLSASACGSDAQSLPAPAQAVQALLELRLERSTDATAYARFIESTEVAGTLAADAKDSKDAPIPEWQKPEVEASSETTAAVVIVWKPSDAFANWPDSTTFQMKKVDGRWVVVDAVESRAEDTSSTPSGGQVSPGETPTSTAP